MSNEAENPRAVAGNNSGVTVDDKQLKSFVERIERLTEEKKSIATDIRDVYGEAVSAGFDRKALARCVAERAKRAKDAQKHKAENDVFDVYACRLGIFA
jgi:uncharacterized protein (UPF0335 family)